MAETTTQEKGERIAKVIARAGLASRRGAETMIAEGRVTLNGKRLDTPAMTVSPGDEVLVDGRKLPRPEPARLWRYHKPKGLITTTRDAEGRPTVFERLPPELPRVVSVGRLDINTEGLLLLTNDGEVARHLELPGTGWLRRYRVRAFGTVEQDDLDALKDGPVIDGIRYGAVLARIERRQGDNVWMVVDLREGKNREIKRVLENLGLKVNRLIRVSYGPFTLEGLERGEVREVPRRIFNEQLPARFRTSSTRDGAEAGAKAAGHGARPGARPGARAAPKLRPKPKPKRSGKPGPGRSGPAGPQTRGETAPGGRKPRARPPAAGAGKSGKTDADRRRKR